MTPAARRALVLFATAAALAAPGTVARAAEATPPPVFRGTWIATAGPTAVMHGSWSAQAIPGQLDDVQGSWSMVNDAGAVTAQGTWSAHRATRGFKGKWWARGATGGLYTGTFEAHLPGFKGKTLQDMFADTKTRQISGFWRTSGGARGAWYFKGAEADGPSP
jgi:hypothetical protein